MTRLSRWIVNRMPQYQKKEFWIEQGIRLGSWITIIIIFLALRDIALTPPYCPMGNISLELIENASRNMTHCVCSP